MRKSAIQAIAGLFAFISLCALGLEPDPDTSLLAIILTYAAAAITLIISLLVLTIAER